MSPKHHYNLVNDLLIIYRVDTYMQITRVIRESTLKKRNKERVVSLAHRPDIS